MCIISGKNSILPAWVGATRSFSFSNKRPGFCKTVGFLSKVVHGIFNFRITVIEKWETMC